MNGSRGWMRFVTASAALALSACGAQSYRAEQAQAPERSAETCSEPNAVASCEARVHDYTGELDALLGPGVAPGVPTAGTPEPAPEEIPAYPREQIQSAPAASPAENAPVQRSAAIPDCPAARDLRDRICELADAICALAARAEAAPETTTSCTSSRTSCEGARTRVAVACE